MSIFPEHPRLESAPPKDGREMRRLVEDHVTFVKFCLGWSLMVVVKAGYETDGASVTLSSTAMDDEKNADQIKSLIRKYFPGEEVMSVYNKLVGTPWDMPRLLAAIVHDALYSLKWFCRYLCDRVYKKILAATDYALIRREIEYDVIRLVGWRNWNAVTKDEQGYARKFVTVKWVRTSKIPSIVSGYKSQNIGLFTKGKIGILFLLLFQSGASAVAQYIADNNLQQKAYEFVKELTKRDDLTNSEKAKVFNKKMFEYGKKIGKVLGDSVLNCLRELAVNAVKAEKGC